MSKSIYYVEFTKADQSIGKFKFAIDNSKNTIQLVKEEIKLKLIAKKEITQNDQITMKDNKDFELFSDDEIEDVLPQKQKNIKLYIKVNPQVSQVDNTKFSTNIQSLNISPKINQSLIPTLASQNISISSHMLPYQQQKCNEDEIQIKFICPQFYTDFNKVYGIKIKKSNSYYQLSTQICKKFQLISQFSKVKALIFDKLGQPLFWDIDFMGFSLQNINPSQKYYIIFTNTTSTFQNLIPIRQITQQKHLIFIKLKQPIGIKVDLQKTTVNDLKVLIYEKLKIHPSNQIIRLGIKNLEILDQPLHLYGVIENTVLTLLLKKNHNTIPITFSDNFYNSHIAHLYPQSPKALRCFRSNMMIFVKHLSEKDKIKILVFLRLYSQNPALVCCISTLFNQGNMSETQKIALQQGFYNLFYRIILNSKDYDQKYPTNEIFSLTRQILGWLLQTIRNMKDSDDYEQRQYVKQYSAICPVTQAKILDPVYIKLNNNNGVVSDRITILEYIKNKKSFTGVSNLTQNCIIEDKTLKYIYDIFKQNNSLQDFYLTLFMWTPKIDQIDFLPKYIESLPLKIDKLQSYTKSLGTLNQKLKIHHPLELKTKIEYYFLLKDKKNEEKIFIGKNKDINNPQNVYDVITGTQIAVNFDILGAAASSENLEEKINLGDIKAIITKEPQQAIVVILDISGSMGSKFFSQPDLKRIGAVKSFFEAFAYRTMAYNFQHVISLILFDAVINVTCDFTQSFQDFNRFVSSANPRGATLLYDALQTAAYNLIQFKKKYPNCVLRILALTDGEDTGSKCSLVNITQYILKNNIILDSFAVGTNCLGLKAISFATGGKCYLTRNIEDSLKLFQQQTVISYRSRKSVQRPKYTDLQSLIQRMNLKPFDLPNNIHQFKMPEIEKPALNSSQINDKIKNNPNNYNNGSMKRIIKEFNNYQSAPHPFVSIFSCADMNLWKLLLLGPKGTPYQNGLFLLYAKFPTDYPFKPPEVRFITPIYHCNMNSQGRICHSVFDRNYSPAVTIKTIIDSVYGLILTPEPDDPLDNVIATYFLSDYPKYFENAKKSTAHNASKPLQDIVEDLFGKITDDNQRQKKIEELREWKRKAESFN